MEVWCLLSIHALAQLAVSHPMRRRLAAWVIFALIGPTRERSDPDFTACTSRWHVGQDNWQVCQPGASVDAIASQAGHLLSTPSAGIISVPRLSSARPRDGSRAQELVQASLRHLPSGRAAIHPVAEDAAAEAAADYLRGGKRGKRAKPVHMGRAERESLADALLRCLSDYGPLVHPCRPGLSCIFANLFAEN